MKSKRVDENFAGDIGVTGLVQKGLSAIGINFKGTAREAYGILLAYFNSNKTIDKAKPYLTTIGNAINSMTRNKKRMVNANNPGEQAKSIGDAAIDGAWDSGSSIAAVKKARAAKAAGTVGKQVVKKGATNALAKGLGTAVKALAGPVGWAMLGADLANDAINIVNACRRRKNPTLAPKQALSTLTKFFNSRGKKANNSYVQTALRSLNMLVKMDEQRLSGKPGMNMTNKNNTIAYTNTNRNTRTNLNQNTYGTQTQQYGMVGESRRGTGKKVIRLTESDLNRMIAESVEEIINEGLVSNSLKFLGRNLVKYAKKYGVPALEKLAAKNKRVDKFLKSDFGKKLIYGKKAAQKTGNFTSTATNGANVSYTYYTKGHPIANATGNAASGAAGSAASGAAGGVGDDILGSLNKVRKGVNKGLAIGALAGATALGVRGCNYHKKAKAAQDAENARQEMQMNQTNAQPGTYNYNGGNGNNIGNSDFFRNGGNGGYNNGGNGGYNNYGKDYNGYEELQPMDGVKTKNNRRAVDTMTDLSNIPFNNY